MSTKMTPQLRFPDFTDGWQVKKLGDVFDRVTRKNKENNQNILTISAQDGLVSQEKFFSKIVAAKDVSGYYLLHKNDYAYNKSYSKGYPMGAIKRLSRDEKGVVSTLYICFSSKQGLELFFDQYFEAGRLNTEIEKIAQEGARNHGLLNMAVGDFFTTKLVIPVSKPEQEKIADFLTAVDERIAVGEKKLELLETYKRGVMQKIFSQQIRFKDENGSPYPDWEVRKLGEVATKVGIRNKSTSATDVLTNSAVHGVILQTDFFDKEIAVQGNLSNYYKTQIDDFVYNPRISTNAPVGPFKRNNYGDGVMSPLYNIFRFNESKSLDYFEQYLATNYWHKYMRDVANYGARSDRMAISSSDLLSLPFPYPSQEEQQKIATFLTTLDDKITVEKSKLAAARKFKKALLQRMFV